MLARRPILAPCLACVIGVALAGAAPCRADASSDWQFQQFIPSGLYGFAEERGFSPPLSERDLNAIGDALALDESQRDALTDLYRSLISEFKSAWVANREYAVDSQLRAEAESGEMGDWNAIMIDQMEQRERFQKVQEGLVETLFSDLKLLLTPEQEEKWPSVERDRRRATTLSPLALHDEEALDLVSLVKGLDLTPGERAAAAPILARYADQLDSVLATRNRAAHTLGEDASTFYRDQQTSMSLWRTDPEKAQQGIADQTRRQEALVPEALTLRDACDKVRDLNRAYIRELDPIIPDGARSDWDRAVRAKRESALSMFWSTSRASMSLRMIQSLDAQIGMFATVFGDESESNDMMRIFRAAEPLTREQRDSIKDLNDRHDARVQAIKQSHAPVKEQPSDPSTLTLQTPMGSVVIRRVDAQDDGSGYGFMGMGQPDPETTKELRALDLETLRELRSILTINQRAAICMW